MPSVGRRLVGGLLIALAMSRPLGAQQRSAIDLGVSYVRFIDDSTDVFGPSLRWYLARQRGGLYGSADLGGVATAGAATGSVSLDGGWRRSLAAGWMGELGGEAGSVLGSQSHASTSGLGSARALWMHGDGGAWARMSGHVARREAGALWGRGIDAGAWWRWSRAELTASIAREWATAQLFAARFHEGFVGTVPVRYTEGALTLRVEGDLASIDLMAGARRDPDAAQLVEPTYSATAAFWQTPTLAWTVSLARQLPDFVRGADATRAVSVGLRLKEPTPAAARASRVRPIIQVALDEGGRVMRVRAAGAHRVEVMGDFTDWLPLELTPQGGVFERAVRITPGSHRVVVRIDGGEWRPAANTPAVDDDLGGRAGLLVLP